MNEEIQCEHHDHRIEDRTVMADISFQVSSGKILGLPVSNVTRERMTIRFSMGFINQRWLI